MSTLAAKPKQRYSYADYLTWLDDVRREIIDGVVTELEHSQWTQQATASVNISSLLYGAAERNRKEWFIVHAPFDVRFPGNGKTEHSEIFTVVQPDICVMCDESQHDELSGVGAPDLVVEIVSHRTASRDYHIKRDLYERSGVREYWIVSPGYATAEIFVLQKDGRYDDGTIYDEDNTKVKSILFPEITFELNEFFE